VSAVSASRLVDDVLALPFLDAETPASKGS